MNYRKAYHHMFGKLTELIIVLEESKAKDEEINVPILLKALQAECEEICISDAELLHKAPRHGSSAVPR